MQYSMLLSNDWEYYPKYNYNKLLMRLISRLYDKYIRWWLDMPLGDILYYEIIMSCQVTWWRGRAITYGTSPSYIVKLLKPWFLIRVVQKYRIQSLSQNFVNHDIIISFESILTLKKKVCSYTTVWFSNEYVEICTSFIAQLVSRQLIEREWPEHFHAELFNNALYTGTNTSRCVMWIGST